MRNGKLFKKDSQVEVSEDYVEAKEIPFFQFINDGAALKNKRTRQAFGVAFLDRRLQYNNDTVLSLRKVLSRKSDKVSELVEKACVEVADKKISEIVIKFQQN